jgi:hypothetical protein
VVLIASWSTLTLCLVEGFHAKTSTNAPLRQLQKTRTRASTSSNNVSARSSFSDSDIAKKIMYHNHRKRRERMRYQIIAAPGCESLARRIEDVRSVCMLGCVGV